MTVESAIAVDNRTCRETAVNLSVQLASASETTASHSQPLSRNHAVSVLYPVSAAKQIDQLSKLGIWSRWFHLSLDSIWFRFEF